MLIILWIALALAAGFIAEKKGRSGPAWFFVGLIPLIGIILALAISDNAPHRQVLYNAEGQVTGYMAAAPNHVHSKGNHLPILMVILLFVFLFLISVGPIGLSR